MISISSDEANQGPPFAKYQKPTGLLTDEDIVCFSCSSPILISDKALPKTNEVFNYVCWCGQEHEFKRIA